MGYRGRGLGADVRAHASEPCAGRPGAGVCQSRCAALIAMGHPGYTFILLLLLLAVSFACVVFLPVYVLVGLVFVSLVQTHALREIRRRHGDLVSQPDEEVGRL